MARYYVIRDKDTGLYFRGKGANRWGKYYNQASIYRIKANAENTIKEVSWRGEQAEIVPIRIVETTEDVVPKSEVEALEKELVESYKKLDESVNFYCSFTKSKIQNCPIDVEVAKAKQEVAREIFEEIERNLVNANFITGNVELNFGYYLTLKKEYTKGEHDE